MTIVRVAFVLVALAAVHGSPTPKSAPLELIILHNNDMHARFEQTGKYSNTCQPEDVTANHCYGGFARVAYKLKEYRDKAANGGTPVLYLNAGDTYAGTPWFTLYKDKIVTEFLNLLKPDAISLGNHEFDRNVDGLVPFLNEAHFPVLIANLDASKEPTLASAKALKKSTTFNVNGVNVGVIGYLTPETKFLAPPNEVQFTDEIEAINAEAAVLKANGVNIIIALGHSGLDADKKIAAACKDIDLLIGGHSHTFLYTGKQPDAEVPTDTYPVMVTRADGSTVPVVQAYAFTKYLGYLHLNFDANGKLEKFDGTPILLDGAVPRDPDVLTVLEKYRPGITQMQNEVVAKSMVFLNGTCRFDECNMGNFIADSMVYGYAKAYQGPYWTDAPIAFIQGGGIRTSITRGNITGYDLTTLLPFESLAVTMEVTGTELKSALEHAVYRYDGKTGWGEFLQMSGVRVAYNISEPSLSRVKSVDVLCGQCDVPSYSPLDLTATYKIIVSSFLQLGGDGFDMLKKPYGQLAWTEQDVTRDYMKQLEIIYPPVEWRIKITGRSAATALHVSIAFVLVSAVVSWL